MGVRGLTKLVKGIESPPSWDPSRSPGNYVELFIDGDSMVHFIVKKSQTAKMLACGGDYHAMVVCLKEIIRDLPFPKINIYFDGKKPAEKAQTMQKRRKTKVKEWFELRSGCPNSSDIGKTVLPPSESSEFPVPPLSYAVLQSECKILYSSNQHDINVVNCDGEADYEVAKAAATTPRALVLGNDSDYFCMKGISYVELNDLNKLCDKSPLPVWTRSFVAEQMDISEEELIQFAITRNDFTSHLACFASYPSTINGVLKKLSAQSLFDTNDPELQHAIEYSRAFYNSLPLPVQQTQADPPSEEEDIDEPKYPLELEFLCDGGWSSIGVVGQGLSLSSLVDVMREENNLWLKQEHLDATVLQQENAEASGANDENIIMPIWEDVQACYCIQVFLRSAHYENDPPFLKYPHKVFNGQSFHTALRKLRSEQLALSPASSLPPQQSSAALPVDEHKDEILEHIRSNRVTIINGETGCGKSSRIPIFLIEDDNSSTMMVSQPRRIAAKGLAVRVKDSLPHRLKSSVGLRMGYGIREESKSTRLWFVTTGYIVRLLASYPHFFDSHSHLIIDEVHERSVDTDILCLLCKRLLRTNPNIRLVLMSATLSVDIYKKYFGVTSPHIFVGARRYPVELTYIDDVRGNAKYKEIIMKADNANNRIKDKVCKAQLKIAVSLCKLIGKPSAPSGTGSILIFVPGMSEIETIMENFDEINARGGPDSTHFRVLPLHSDIPSEEQMVIFEPSLPGQVKVVVATNAAESSITISDCDNVIDLGLCKSMMYSDTQHREELVKLWISKASAEQRAGRTGRTRPGNVYRLYSQKTYKSMIPFEVGEIHRSSLDTVVLNLREMCPKESVDDLLGETIEPPANQNVLNSLRSLASQGLLKDSGPDADMTYLGDFVASLGVDLRVGCMVGWGIQINVASAAIMLAACITVKAPWRVASTVVHKDPDVYNDLMTSTFLSKVKFDAGLYSQPISLVRLLLKYRKERARAKNPSAYTNKFAKTNHLAHMKLQSLVKFYENLKAKVEKKVGRPFLDANVKDPAIDPVLLNRLRLLLAWAHDDSLIVSSEQLEFDPNRHPIDTVALVGPLLPQAQAENLLAKLPAKDKNATSYESKRVEIVTHSWNHNFNDVTSEVGEASELVSQMEGNFLLKFDIIWLVTPYQESVAELPNNDKDVLYRIDVISAKHVHFNKYTFDTLLSGSMSVEEEPTEIGFIHYIIRFVKKITLKKAKKSMFKTWLLSDHAAFGVRVDQTHLNVETNTGEVPDADLKALFGDAALNLSLQIQQGKDIQHFKFSPSVPSLKSTFYDAPLGARLLTNLCQYRKKQTQCLKIWTDDCSEEAVKKREKENQVPGTFSLQPYLACQFKLHHGEAVVKMERAGSVVGCISPCISDPTKSGDKIYGVASSVLFINDGKCVIADSVTLFPFGVKWIAMASLCLTSSKRFEYEQLSCEEEELCKTISIGMRSRGSLTVQHKMIKLVDRLFSDFIFQEGVLVERDDNNFGNIDDADFNEDAENVLKKKKREEEEKKKLTGNVAARDEIITSLLNEEWQLHASCCQKLGKWQKVDRRKAFDELEREGAVIFGHKKKSSGKMVELSKIKSFKDYETERYIKLVSGKKSKIVRKKANPKVKLRTREINWGEKKADDVFTLSEILCNCIVRLLDKNWHNACNVSQKLIQQGFCCKKERKKAFDALEKDGIIVFGHKSKKGGLIELKNITSMKSVDNLRFIKLH